MRFPCVLSHPPFRKFRDSLAPHASLRGRQTFGRVPAPAPFRGRRCPACGFRLRPCLEPPLNRPGTFRFPGSALRGGMRGRFPLPHPGAGGTVPAGPRLDAAPCCPAILDTPPETAPVPLRSRTASPRLAHGSLHFNLAHSDSLALLAVRQDAPVGVDVEPVRPLPEAMLIACRWFSAPEIRWIAASDDRDRAFLRCWVCREAFLKATGEGLGRPLDSFALHPCGDTLRLDGAALAECTPLAGHVAAVACETLFPSC